MTAIPMTRQDARKVLTQIITVPFLFANGYMWYRFFLEGISEHADEIEGWSLLCFLICSGWGALTLMGSLGIMLQITRHMEKRWGFEDDGKDEGEDEGSTARERITRIMKDVGEPMRKLEIWQRLLIEMCQHHPGYLSLSEVRKEMLAMNREGKVQYYQECFPDGSKQTYWYLTNILPEETVDSIKTEEGGDME